MDRCSRGLYALLAAGAFLLVSSTRASAQFQPRTLSDPATGEQFHIEGSIGFWAPGADMNISSDQFGISGTPIDFKRDLNLVDSKFTELHVVFKPARKHKLRLQYVPVRYEQQRTLTSDIIFNGQRFRAGNPVTSELNWNAYRFSYEYDFISTNRGFGGVILDVKYTDVFAQLQSSNQSPENMHEQLPIPSLGGIARFYIVPNISATFEMTGMAIPQAISDQFRVGGHYKEIEAYGTINLTNNVGFQGGYRALDLGYLYRGNDGSTGSLLLKGVFFGITARY